MAPPAAVAVAALSSGRQQRRLRVLGRHLLGGADLLGHRSSGPRPLAAEGGGALSVEPVTPHMGAEVFGFDFARMLNGDEALLREVDDLFMKYKVLMFRDANLDRGSHLKFMGALVHYWGLDDPSKLGPGGTEAPQARQILGPHGCVVDPFLPQIKGFEEVWPVDYSAGAWGRIDQGVEEVVNDRRSGGSNSSGYGGRANSAGVRSAAQGAANSWHSDQMFFAQPSAVTSIRAVRLPSVGGDTLFANMERAYEDLDDATKARLEKLEAENNQPLMNNFKKNAERTGDTAYYDWLSKNFYKTKTPVVRIHPVTKKKALYVNKGYTKSIFGPGAEDEPGGSKALIKRLTDLAKVPEYQCRFRWRKVGDLIMWDNRSVQHYAIGDYGDPEAGGGPRWMDHVTTSGTTPMVGVPS